MGYVCKYCGYKSNNSLFAGQYCTKSPTKKHIIMNEKSNYVCKYCGFTSTNPISVTLYCTKSPHKKHEWIE